MLTFIILSIVGFGLAGIAIFLLIKKKTKENVIQPVQPENKPSSIHILTQEQATPQRPTISDNDIKLYDVFMKEYDTGDMKFDNLHYRKGAHITCGFNLAEGYVLKKDGTMEWGYVRIHSGIDRAGGGTVGEIPDIVMSPFNFEKSLLQDFNGVSYGALITLYNLKYQFEFRIAHMNPQKNIIPWTLEHLKLGNPIKRDWLIGSAGTYGYSSGNHTHTEIKSIDEACEVMEILLEQKYGQQVFLEYTTEDILKFYRLQTHFAKADDKTILQNWAALKKNKQIVFSNQYLYRCVYFDKKIHTFYNTYALMGL